MKSNKWIEFDTLSISRGYLLISDENNQKVYILNPSKDTIHKSLKIQTKYKQIEFHSDFIYKDITYESLSFSNSDLLIIEKIFEYISDNNIFLFDAVNNIEKIFAKILEIIPLTYKRGIFAELYSIINLQVIPKERNNSIYDATDINGCDVEIKSFSTITPTICLSFQQITNNKNAKLYAIEVIETSNGSSLKEMYLKLPEFLKYRYDWLDNDSYDNDLERFSIGNIFGIIQKNINDLLPNLTLPKHVKDATYVISVEKL